MENLIVAGLTTLTLVAYFAAPTLLAILAVAILECFGKHEEAEAKASSRIPIMNYREQSESQVAGAAIPLRLASTTLGDPKHLAWHTTAR